jgi:hypothetical protein
VLPTGFLVKKDRITTWSAEITKGDIIRTGICLVMMLYFTYQARDPPCHACISLCSDLASLMPLHCSVPAEHRLRQEVA